MKTLLPIARVLMALPLLWSSEAAETLSALQTRGARSSDERIPAEYRVTIAGRILSEDKRPLANVPITLSETDPDNVVFHSRTDPPSDGKSVLTTAGGSSYVIENGALRPVKVLNPSGKSGLDGQFSILADRRFWAKTGYFTLLGGLVTQLRGGRMAGILRKPGGEKFVVSDDRTTATLLLGDIVVFERYMEDTRP